MTALLEPWRDCYGCTEWHRPEGTAGGPACTDSRREPQKHAGNPEQGNVSEMTSLPGRAAA